MDNKICLVVCSLVYHEIRYVFKEEDYPDVSIKPFPTICFTDDKKAEWFRKRVEHLKGKYDKVVFLGSWCFASKVVKESGLIDVIVLDHCFEIFVNKEIIFHLIAKRNYLVTKGWLKELKHHKESWGFDPDTAKKFFHESTEGIVLIDTGFDGDYTEKLDELSEYMGVPYTVLPVGLSHAKLFLGRIINEWREKKERILANKNLLITSQKSADYQLAFKGMQDLVELRDETKIINNVFRVLDIFLSPREIIYLPLGKNIRSDKPIFFKGNIVDYDKTNCNFYIELRNTGESYGRIEIINVSFPEYIERYKEIARIIGMVTALAISNARKFTEVKEQELLLTEKSNDLQKEVNTKNLFFSIIAHDLRGPFHGLLGLIEIIKDDLSILPVEKIREFLESIHQLATNTYELLEELLMWARTQQGNTEYNPETVCFCDTIKDVFGNFEERAKQKEIQLIDNCRKMKLLADKNMIKTILRNLIGNAIKFTGEGGSIEVGAELIDTKWVKLFVKDTGMGMSPEKISKLFELGEKISTHGTRGEGGSGLGLLLCKEFVKIHGGKIWVESTEGKGSHFCFTMKFAELG